MRKTTFVDGDSRASCDVRRSYRQKLWIGHLNEDAAYFLLEQKRKASEFALRRERHASVEIVERRSSVASSNALDEIAREGARKMLMAALREEADTYVEQFANELDENGHRLVRRKGIGRERSVQTVAGTLDVQAPRVDDQRVDEDGNKATFRSANSAALVQEES